MKFVDREDELEIIRKVVKKRGLAVIYGRRRVGKTRLIKEATKNFNKVFIVVPDSRPKRILSSIEEDISEAFGTKVSFDSIENALDFAFKSFDLVVIDEFQNLWWNYPEIIGYLFRKIEKDRKALIISGSYSRMNELLEYGEPLFGRAHAEIYLKPLKPAYVIEICKEINTKPWLSFYMIFGGIPHYYALLEFYELRDFESSVDFLFLQPSSPLIFEGKRVLEYEFKGEWKTLFTVLESIGASCSTFSKISRSSGIAQNSLSKYLLELSSRKLIGKFETVIGKRSCYYIRDHFLRFWFSCIYPCLKFHDASEFEKYRECVSERIDNNMPLFFEHVAREAVAEVFKGYKITRQWGKHKDYGPYEIDIAALSPDKKELVLAEVKWQDKKLGKKELEELREKASLLGFEGKIKYLLIGKKVAKLSEPDAEAWDLGKLEAIFRGGKV